MNSFKEETFDSLIEYDPVGSDIESEKENIEQEGTDTGAVEKKKKRLNCTTATQLNMLASFMECRRGFEKGAMRKTPENEKLLKEWSDLVDRLNHIGPPVRSNTDWRKTWSDFKRRKNFSVSQTHTMSPSQSSSTAAEISSSHQNISGTGCSSSFGKEAEDSENGSVTAPPMLDGMSETFSVSERSDVREDDKSQTTSDLNEIKQYCKQILEILQGSQNKS